jgi:tetratricopeptide (TPR) repeat protein
MEMRVCDLAARGARVLPASFASNPFLDRILQLENGHVDTLHHVIPSLAYVDLAWAEGNIGLAQEHADRAFSLAVTSGNPYLRVYAQACRGLSHIVARRLTSAIEDLSGALSFARSRKAGLENEPRILADLANAYRLNGDIATALTTVDEAIKVAAERHARVPECLARIVRADLLLRTTTSDQKAEARQELERARALMRETGPYFSRTSSTPQMLIIAMLAKYLPKPAEKTGERVKSLN